MIPLSVSREAIQYPCRRKQQQSRRNVDRPARERVKESVRYFRAVVMRQHTRTAYAYGIRQDRNRHRRDHENQRAPDSKPSTGVSDKLQFVIFVQRIAGGSLRQTEVCRTTGRICEISINDRQRHQSHQ